MGFLTLYSGLLLPWLAGTLWLIFVESKFNNNYQPNRFRQTGYGFFLGYMVLFLAIMVSNKLTGTVSWSGLMGFLLIFTAGGGIAVWKNQDRGHTTTLPSQVVPSTPIKLLTAITLVLMAIHFIFIAVEIFTQPVYPWDAWLVWIYRAKAWFMAGTMTEVVSATDWAAATSVGSYTVDAWSYPLFASVIPYWAVLSLGHWSETLVNLPVLFAGIAMGLALYGQCREHGINIPLSLITCYLLYSIPLFATHLALAGYADIWMAGFTGLGFLALIQGTCMHTDVARSRFQILLGMSIVIFGVWVKNEGAVWLLAALAMMALVTCRPRSLVLMMLAVAMVTLLIFILGLSHIDIPVLGGLGFVDGRVVIPFIGSFVFEAHSVQQLYWNNFINMGSWNLFWVLVTASLLLSLRPCEGPSNCRARRVVLSFFLIFLATQLFIFGFTNHGLWADTYTAINRLPLHLVPALLFSIVVIAHVSLTQYAAIDSGPKPESGKV